MKSNTLSISLLISKEYNANYWCVMVHPLYGRRPVSLPRLSSLLGSKIYVILRKLAQNKMDKFVVRPFHGETYIFYRH